MIWNREALLTLPSPPNWLSDSHKWLWVGESGAVFCGVEVEPSFEHDHRSRFSIVSGPSAETRADPSGVSEGGFGMRVLLALGVAFKPCAEGFEERLIFRLEGIGQGSQGSGTLIAVPGMDELLDGAAATRVAMTSRQRGA